MYPLHKSKLLYTGCGDLHELNNAYFSSVIWCQSFPGKLCSSFPGLLLAPQYVKPLLMLYPLPKVLLLCSSFNQLFPIVCLSLNIISQQGICSLLPKVVSAFPHLTSLYFNPLLIFFFRLSHDVQFKEIVLLNFILFSHCNKSSKRVGTVSVCLNPLDSLWIWVLAQFTTSIGMQLIFAEQIKILINELNLHTSYSFIYFHTGLAYMKAKLVAMVNWHYFPRA